MSELNFAMDLAAQGMKAQSMRMRVISQNIANSETTSLEAGGDPYRRQTLSFRNQLDRSTGVNNVVVEGVRNDDSDFVLKLDPSHPAADENGYVKMPNVNPLVEMMDMREAQRSYEANLGIIDMSRTMLMRTIDLLRS